MRTDASKLRKLEARQKQLERQLRRALVAKAPTFEVSPLPVASMIAKPVFQEAKTPVSTKATVPVSVPPPLPKKTTEEPVGWEFSLGTKGLVRIGMVLIVVGLVLAANYAYQHLILGMGPWPKVLALSLVTAVILGLAEWLERTQVKLQAYARVLLAGGMSLGFYLVYGLHNVEALRVVQHETAGLFFLLVWTLILVGVADRKRSPFLGAFTLLLGFVATNLAGQASTSLEANAFLALAAVVLGLRRGWPGVAWMGLLGAYCCLAWWRVTWLLDWSELRRAAVHDLSWTLSWLTAYWLVFSGAAWLSAKRGWSLESRLPWALVNHVLFFLLTWSVLPYPAWPFWKWATVFGMMVAAVSFLYQGESRKTERVLHGILALVLLTLASVTYFTGYSLALLLAAESLVVAQLGCWQRSAWWSLLAFFLAFYAGTVVGSLNETAQPWVPLVVAALLMGTTWRLSSGPEPSGAFSMLALGVGLISVWSLADWIHGRVGEVERAGVYALAFVGVALLGHFGKIRVLTRAALLLLVLGLYASCEQSGIQARTWMQLLPGLVVLVWQQVARRISAPWTESWHRTAIVIGCGSLTIEALQWADTWENRHWLTLVWVALGIISFTVGFRQRERAYRWYALMTLGWALLRVVFGDVWNLGTGWRIVSVLGLGVALLGLGYVYNRYQDRLKEWL